MSIRNCGELGKNLQKIVTRLLANEELVKLLYYEGKDPLSQNALTQEQINKEVYQKLIRIVPQYNEDDNNKSILVVYVQSGNKLGSNSEFKAINIVVDVIVPLETWMIKDSNLRPFAILGRVQESLEGKTINGLGKISGGNFGLTNITPKTSLHSQTFTITEYD